VTKLSLSIIMLGVTDLERSAAFYVEKLGMRAARRWL
jgi:catechol 2,3-dioxygenase-like lactoylglutathione lyase family enzyme